MTTSRNEAPGVPRWTALTHELRSSTSPIRTFVSQLTTSCRDVGRRYRDAVGPIQVPSSGANPGTIGAAFDFALRLLLDPTPNLALAAYGAHPHVCGPRVTVAFRHLVDHLGARVSRGPTTPVAEPRVVPHRHEDTVLRAAWALALLTEVYRVGLQPGSPLATLADADHPVDLLGLAPPAAVEELAALVTLARHRLIPPLAERPAPWYIGPTFIGSALVSADADLIAGGLLLEIKTTLGEKRPDGTRRARLEPDLLRQLYGYALLDFDDHYQISDVGVYDARYGHLATWPLPDLLAQTAQHPVDITAIRQQFRTLLDP